MKKQLILGVGILVAFLILGLVCQGVMVRTCSPISQMLTQAGQLCHQGQMHSAEILAKSAAEKWQAHWYAIGVLADHTPMDEIDGLFAQAKAYARQRDAAGFCASCYRLASLIDAIAEAHSLTWWNVL